LVPQAVLAGTFVSRLHARCIAEFNTTGAGRALGVETRLLTGTVRIGPNQALFIEGARRCGY
jgi:hypothetical protein